MLNEPFAYSSYAKVKKNTCVVHQKPPAYLIGSLTKAFKQVDASFFFFSSQQQPAPPAASSCQDIQTRVLGAFIKVCACQGD